MNMLDKAIALAVEKHAGVVDRGGNPYILHPLRVMDKVNQDKSPSNRDVMIVAVLHDVVEDTDVTFEDLLEMGFSYNIVAALDCITKRDGENYDDFISRSMTNELALKVKIADIEDNMDVRRWNGDDENNARRLIKYTNAYKRLIAK